MMTQTNTQISKRFELYRLCQMYVPLQDSRFLHRSDASAAAPWDNASFAGEVASYGTESYDDCEWFADILLHNQGMFHCHVTAFGFTL